MLFPKILTFAPILFLIACGGGGGGGGGASASPAPSPSKPPNTAMPPVKPPLSSYEKLLFEANGFLAMNNLENGFAGHVTLPKNMPQSGTAHFTGASILAIGNCTNQGGPHLVGKSNLTADFKNRKISGSLSEFSAIANHKTNGGKLNVSGTINGNKVTGKLAGNVGFDNKSFAIDHQLAGVFLNKAGDVVLASEGKTKSSDRFSATITASRVSQSK